MSIYAYLGMFKRAPPRLNAVWWVLAGTRVLLTPDEADTDHLQLRSLTAYLELCDIVALWHVCAAITVEQSAALQTLRSV